MNNPRIIDSLTYLGRDLNREEYQFSTPDSLKAVLDKYRLTGALVCAFACNTLGVEYGNKKLFKALEGNTGLIPCPAVLPNGCGEVGDEGTFLDGLIERGARFCCLFLESARTSLDRRVIGSLFAALEKRRLPAALFHADLLAAATLAGEYPRLPILIHSPSTRDRIFWPLFRQTPNLYFSTAANFAHYRALDVLARGNGADRILFASGYPVSEPGAALANLMYSDLKDADRRKIAADNLERLMAGVKTGGIKRQLNLSGLPARKTPPEKAGVQSVVWKRQPVPWDGIVDMHAHYGKWRDFPVFGGLAKDLVKEMDRVGVEKMIVAHQACMTPEVAWGNDQVLAAIAEYPGRLAGYAACYPVDKQLGIGEIRRCIEGGMTGIKLHTAAGLAYTDERYRPVWEYANKHRLPVLLHTWGNIASYEQIFKHYRHTPILLGHSGSANPGLYVNFARKYPNLYLEIVLSAAPCGLVEYFVREAGAERVLYGSDAPWLSMQHQLGRVLFADISEADKKKILVENPRRILKGIHHG